MVAMIKSLGSVSGKAGLPPGSLIHVGERKIGEVEFTILDYSSDTYQSENTIEVSKCLSFKESETVSWINVDGLHDIEKLAGIGRHYGLNDLLLEDILDTHHRPKFEPFDHYAFLTLKMVGIDENKKLAIEQVSFVLGTNWLLSFQEQKGDVFTEVRKRLESNKGPIRKKGGDYLFYRLVDTVVDYYFLVTEHLTEAISKLEEDVLDDNGQDVLAKVQGLKRDLLNVRKAVNPLKDAILQMLKEPPSQMKKATTSYMRDVTEHLVQISESIDSQRDLLSGIIGLYHSNMSNATNKVMQTLTVMATIFIPLTFLAGIYGMNFNFMPELQWKYGYFVFLGVMLAVALVMVFHFKRKGWL